MLKRYGERRSFLRPGGESDNCGFPFVFDRRAFIFGIRFSVYRERNKGIPFLRRRLDDQISAHFDAVGNLECAVCRIFRARYGDIVDRLERRLDVRAARVPYGDRDRKRFSVKLRLHAAVRCIRNAVDRKRFHPVTALRRCDYFQLAADRHTLRSDFHAAVCGGVDGIFGIEQRGNFAPRAEGNLQQGAAGIRGILSERQRAAQLFHLRAVAGDNVEHLRAAFLPGAEEQFVVDPAEAEPDFAVLQIFPRRRNIHPRPVAVALARPLQADVSLAVVLQCAVRARCIVIGSPPVFPDTGLPHGEPEPALAFVVPARVEQKTFDPAADEEIFIRRDVIAFRIRAADGHFVVPFAVEGDPADFGNVFARFEQDARKGDLRRAVGEHMQLVDRIFRDVAREQDEVDKTGHLAFARAVVNARREEEHALPSAEADAESARRKRVCIFLRQCIAFPPIAVEFEDHAAAADLNAAAHLVCRIAVVVGNVAVADERIESHVRIRRRAVYQRKRGYDGTDHEIFAAADVAQDDLVAPVRIVNDGAFVRRRHIHVGVRRRNERPLEGVFRGDLAAHFDGVGIVSRFIERKNVCAVCHFAEIDVSAVVRRTLDNVFLAVAEPRQRDGHALCRGRRIVRVHVGQNDVEPDFRFAELRKRDRNVRVRQTPVFKADGDHAVLVGDRVSAERGVIAPVDREGIHRIPACGLHLDGEISAEHGARDFRRAVFAHGYIVFDRRLVTDVAVYAAIAPRFQPGCHGAARISAPVGSVRREHSAVEPDGIGAALIAYRKGKFARREQLFILFGQRRGGVVPGGVIPCAVRVADELNAVCAVGRFPIDTDKFAVAVRVDEEESDAPFPRALREQDVRRYGDLFAERLAVNGANVVIRRRGAYDTRQGRGSDAPLRQIAQRSFGNAAEIFVAAVGERRHVNGRVAALCGEVCRGVKEPVARSDDARSRLRQRICVGAAPLRDRCERFAAQAVFGVQLHFARRPVHGQRAAHRLRRICREFCFDRLVLGGIADGVCDRTVVVAGEIQRIRRLSVHRERLHVIAVGGDDVDRFVVIAHRKPARFDSALAGGNGRLDVVRREPLSVEAVPPRAAAPAGAHFVHSDVAEGVAGVVLVAVAVVGIIHVHFRRLFRDAERSVRHIQLNREGFCRAVQLAAVHGSRRIDGCGECAEIRARGDVPRHPLLRLVVADAVDHDLPSAAVVVEQIRFQRQEYLDAAVAVKLAPVGRVGETVVPHLHAEEQTVFGKLHRHRHRNAVLHLPGVGVADRIRRMPALFRPERFVELAVQRYVGNADLVALVFILVIVEFVIGCILCAGGGKPERERRADRAKNDRNLLFHKFPPLIFRARRSRRLKAFPHRRSHTLRRPPTRACRARPSFALLQKLSKFSGRP